MTTDHRAEMGALVAQAAIALGRVRDYWELNDLPPDFATPATGFPFTASLEDTVAAVEEWADTLSENS